VLSELPDDSVNDKIMYRVFKSMDKNTGNGDCAVTEEEYHRAFNPDSPAGGLVRTRLNGKGDVTQTHVDWRHTRECLRSRRHGSTTASYI
jgi:hypothetical protein